jgi:hypothetical protein
MEVIMTDARHRSFWHRAGPLIALAALAGGAMTQGCGDGGGGTNTGGSGPGGTSTNTGTSTGTGTGGIGGTGGTGVGTIDKGIDSPIALDATPDDTGSMIYFTAVGPNGPGVFSAPPEGAAKQLAAGDPFAAPFGIAIGTDGKQLYVADPGADTGGDRGAIFVLPIGGGNPTALSGSADTVPRGLEIAGEGGKDVLYFTGNDKTDGQPGVFKLDAGGGTVSAVAKGAPFRDPGGVAIASNGDLYVSDTVSAASHTAEIIKVSGGAATVLVSDIRIGYPAGVALSSDEKTLFVSGYDPDTLTDRLIAIDLGTNAVSLMFAAEIGSFREAAGLHRAKKAEVFAWADSSAGPAGGKVFVVTFK